MKNHLVPFVIITLLIIGCSNNRPSKYIPFNELSFEDSLAIVNQLFDSLYSEIYQDERYKVVEESEMIYCGAHREFRIRINTDSKIMVNGKIADNITPYIYIYYNTNYEKNDMSNNYVLYSKIDKKEIINQYISSKNAAIEVENTIGAFQEIIDFKWNQVLEWKKVYKAIRTINSDTLKQPEYSAITNIDYPKTSFNKEDVFNEMLLAFYQLRNERSLNYFKKPYIEVFYETILFKKFYRNDALKVMQPINIMDIPYCKENNFWFTNEITPPPPSINY